MPVVGIVFKANHITGAISVIALYSPTLPRPVVFDVYRNPKLYMEGQLHRIFQAEQLVKVVHDCKDFCGRLAKEQYIKCNSMFDTQVAYTLKMEENGLPPRLIAYDNLHSNVVGSSLGQLATYAKVQEKSDGNLWTKRPLSAEMLFALGEEVVSLRLEVYPRVLSSLDEHGLEEFELRCGVAGRGQRLTGTLGVTSAKKRVGISQSPLCSISPRQADLLPHTKPMSSENKPE
ncbi:piRNA biogenesis protein EXD1-like [Watersipora subatra]|uniref:piRNA biogenesis protein EXD1-like n=1 Tax=Watersipora subatra TaxID=2589382 RepID=UPI00355C504E